MAEDFEAKEKQALADEGIVPDEMASDHSTQLENMDKIIRSTRVRMEREIKEKEQEKRRAIQSVMEQGEKEVESKRLEGRERIRKLIIESREQCRDGEKEWQVEAARWLGIAQKKIQLKDQADAEEAT